MGIGNAAQPVEDPECHAAKAQDFGLQDTSGIQHGNQVPLRLKAELLRHQVDQLVVGTFLYPIFDFFQAEAGFAASRPAIDQSQAHCKSPVQINFRYDVRLFSFFIISYRQIEGKTSCPGQVSGRIAPENRMIAFCIAGRECFIINLEPCAAIALDAQKGSP